MSRPEIRVGRNRSTIRRIVGGALLINVLVAGAAPGHAQERAVVPRIEGSWLVTVTTASGTPAPFPALVTYSAGGGLIVTDSSFPPAVGNVYQGTWARTGGREVSFTFLGFQYGEDGRHAGYVRVTETVTLDRSGETYTGLAMFEMLDPEFNVFFSEPNFTRATRVRAR